jgi:hypothetical protein
MKYHPRSGYSFGRRNQPRVSRIDDLVRFASGFSGGRSLRISMASRIVGGTIGFLDFSTPSSKTRVSNIYSGLLIGGEVSWFPVV